MFFFQPRGDLATPGWSVSGRERSPSLSTPSNSRTASTRSRRLPWLAIIALAAVMTLPAALGPVRFNDSFWIDWVWLDQFAREVGHGSLYPRWLPLSHGGLGSPAFYYYPPVSFYVGSVFVLAGASVYHGIVGVFFVAALLAGGGMYWWLKDNAPRPLLGALIFVAAPYNAYNFYQRGAQAEFFAMALLPFVMLGLRRLNEQQKGGFALAALAYAALIATHLPLALLASLFLFAPYTAVMAWRRPASLGRFAAALTTGIALSAIYLLPALLLEPHRDAASLWGQRFYQPANWSVWSAAALRLRPALWSLLIAWALCVPLIVLAVRERSRWAMLGILAVMLAIGIVPGLWSLPLLKSVQFPFRLFPVADFALAAAIASSRLRSGFILLLTAPMLALSAFAISAPRSIEWVTLPVARTLHPDVPENLPPGNRPYSWPSRWALEIAAAHRQPQFANGTTVEPVFYFPAWQVSCRGRQVSTFPDPDTQLLSYRGERCIRTLGWTAAERIGAAVSLAALLALLVASLIGRTRRTRARSLAGTDLRGSEVPA